MEEIVLYAFQGDQFVESLHPRCILFHRLLNTLGVDYQYKTVAPSSDGKKLSQILTTFPFIYFKGQFIYYFSDLRNAMFSVNPEHSFFKSDRPDLPMQRIFTGWADNTLDHFCKYFIFFYRPNWQRLLAKLRSFGNDEATIEVMEKERELDYREIQRSVFNRMQHEEIVEEFFKLQQSLDAILAGSAFLSSDELHISDLIAFSHFHILYNPTFQQIKPEMQNLKNLDRWLKQVDEISAGRYTKSFNF